MISGKDFAQLLDVSPAALSQAARKGHRCSGHPVAQYAVQSPSGRVKGYEVPGKVLRQLGGGAAAPEASLEHARERSTRENGRARSGTFASAEESVLSEVLQALGESQEDPAPANPARTNPDAQQSSKGLMSLPAAQTAAEPEGALPGGTVPAHYQNASVLPPGEDYFRPAAAVSAAAVVRKAIEEDNPAGRALMVVGTGLGAGFLAHEMSEGSSVAGFLGALIGGGTAALVMERATEAERAAEEARGLRAEFPPTSHETPAAPSKSIQPYRRDRCEVLSTPQGVPMQQQGLRAQSEPQDRELRAGRRGTVAYSAPGVSHVL